MDIILSSFLPFDMIEHISTFIDIRDFYIHLSPESELKLNLDKKYKKIVDGNTYFVYKDISLLHSFNDIPSQIKETKGITSFFWHRFGKLHRGCDKPAYIREDFMVWCINGIQHRVGNYAVKYGDRREYWLFGKRHRDKDLPAIEDKEGGQWFFYGKRGRKDDLPTIYYPNKYIAYHKNNKKIREVILDPNFILSGISKLII